MKISRQVIPPGGWKFQQGNTLLISETFDLLVSNVKSHRTSNGIPIGDIASDIEDQIIEKFPKLKRGQVLA